MAIPPAAVPPSAPGASEDAVLQAIYGRAEVIKRDSLELLPVTDDNWATRNIDENFRRVMDLRTPGSLALEPMARLLNGQIISGYVSATEDSEFAIDLDRVPQVIAMQLHEDGLAGIVKGAPAGGLGASGGNELGWQRNRVVVRATIAGRYRFVVA